MSTAVMPLPPVINPAPSLDRGVMRGTDMKARIDAIINIADHAMSDGIDYGKVPGTDKPSLWQAGADKLCVAFQIAPKLRIEEFRDFDEIRYRVIVTGVHQPTGIELGEGAGECSSREEKYAFRFSVHENEWNATPEDRRRLKWKRDGSFIQQIRTNPADQANTVLKMAVKRAKVAMALTVTGAAAVFTQDVEDLAEELRESVGEEAGATPAPKVPQRKSAAAAASTGNAPTSKIPENAEHVLGLVSKVYDDKKPFAIYLKGSSIKFTTFEEKIAAEAKKFAGTDHQVRLSYTTTQKGDNTYHNAVGIAIAEPEPARAAEQPQQPNLTASDIFGGK